MLVSRIGSFQHLRVADLFAGSGALGFEALSRGAASVTFVESDPRALAAIRANASAFGATERASILSGSALSLPQAEPFDLVLADPPYARGSGSDVVAAVSGAGWLAPGGWLAVETARGERVEPGCLMVATERDVGRARLTLMRAA